MPDCDTCLYQGQCRVDDMSSCAHGDNIGRSDYVPKIQSEVKFMIDKTKTICAVPLTELLELRNNLYEMDRITMNGLKMLNELIAKYDGGRKENG